MYSQVLGIRIWADLGGPSFCIAQCLFIAHFKIVICLFITELFFIYSEYKSLIRYMFCTYFLPFHGLSFHFLDGVLWSTKVLNFNEVQFIYFFFLSFVCCLTQGHENLFLCFLLRVLSFKLLHLSIPFLATIYLRWETEVQFYSFPCGYLVALTAFVGNTILFPLNGLGNLGKNQMTINVRVYFQTLNSIPLMCMSTLMPVPYHLDYCSFTVSFEIKKRESSSIILLLKFVLAIQAPLHFHMNFKISLSIFAKKQLGFSFDLGFS